MIANRPTAVNGAPDWWLWRSAARAQEVLRVLRASRLLSAVGPGGGGGGRVRVVTASGAVTSWRGRAVRSGREWVQCARGWRYGGAGRVKIWRSAPGSPARSAAAIA